MQNLLLTIKSLILLFISIIIFVGCSASTGSRYDKNEKDNSNNTSDVNIEIKNPATLNVDLEINTYKTKINIPEKKVSTQSGNQNVWFDYCSPGIETKTKSLVGTSDGYRVLVLTTDNIEEAIKFLNVQILNFIPTQDEFAKVSGKSKMPAMMGHGNPSQKMFEKKVDEILFTEEKLSLIHISEPTRPY